MKAGFDLSDIDKDKWAEAMDAYGLYDVENTVSGWVWKNNETGNFVVTANNPITGEYHCGSKIPRIPEIGYCSYIGIEGDSSFVADFFAWFKENAKYIKDEEFGTRGYI